MNLQELKDRLGSASRYASSECYDEYFHTIDKTVEESLVELHKLMLDQELEEGELHACMQVTLEEVGVSSYSIKDAIEDRFYDLTEADELMLQDVTNSDLEDLEERVTKAIQEWVKMRDIKVTEYYLSKRSVTLTLEQVTALVEELPE